LGRPLGPCIVTSELLPERLAAVRADLCTARTS
jgi:hypothetical protein